jgi:eukaryotic-like serine/threonine-protein kinase
MGFVALPTSPALSLCDPPFASVFGWTIVVETNTMILDSRLSGTCVVIDVKEGGAVNRFSPLSPDDPPMVGGYRLRAKLGSGGMGKVYLSFTPGGRPLAIKVVRPEFAEDQEFRRRFRHEITSAQRVQGIYTAPVIDANADAAVPWLATAYVPGPSLQQVVGEYGPVPLPTVFRLIAGISEALTAVHAAGLIHRDLKPANVLLAEDGPRVIDFGIAHAADATTLTRTGVRIGTPSFMAPEQVLGHHATPATDVFALGQLAVFAATGYPPFGEGQVDALLFRITTQPPALDGCPPGLRDLAARCLAKEPAERPTLAEIIEAARYQLTGAPMEFTQSWLPPSVAAILTGYDPATALPASGAVRIPTELATPAVQYFEHEPTIVQPAWTTPQPGLTVPPVRSRSAVPIVVIIAAAVMVVLIGTVAAALILRPNRSSAGNVSAGAAISQSSGTSAATHATAPTVSAPPTTAPAGSAPPTTTANASPPPYTSDAAAVVQDYYNAINRGDYQAAWQLGGDNLGVSYTRFRNGFGTTANDSVTVTAVNGGTVEVRLTATHTDGSVVYYTGSYTVQNGVITHAAISPV